MKTSVFLGTLAVAGLAAGVAAAGTLDDVKAKGFVQCGISTGVAGFAFTTADGACTASIGCGRARKRSRATYGQ